MTIAGLHHVNIHTLNLEAMIGFYEGVLGLTPGPRPRLRSAGAWLYCRNLPAVHLVDDAKPRPGGDGRIDHFAFRCEGLAETLSHLRGRGVSYSINVVRDLEVRQVNVSDPDGNKVELQFAADEQADLADFPGDPTASRPASVPR